MNAMSVVEARRRFEGLQSGTSPNWRFRPTDCALGTLPKQSPYAVSRLDNSIAYLPLPANLRDCRLAAMGRGGLGSGSISSCHRRTRILPSVTTTKSFRSRE